MPYQNTNETTYKSLITDNSTAAKIYGSTEIHKNYCPLRPTVGNLSYKLAKYITNILKPY